MTMEADPRPVVRVAVIGLGAAGVAQVAQLLGAFARPEVSQRVRLEVVGFEARDTVGGVWNYDADPAPFVTRHEKGKGKEGPSTWVYPQDGEDPTPMYENLRTNLANDLMSYRGFPFAQGTPLFAERSHVLAYLQSYAREKGVLPHVRFRTRVQRLYRPRTPGSRQWTLECLGPDGRAEDEFDHVSVCNGHYSEPYIPSIPGLDTFPGQILHSRFFRRPASFVGQRVLVVGSYASANDITRLLASANNLPYYLPGGQPRTPSTPGQPRPLYTTIYQSGSGAPNAQTAPTSPPVSTSSVSAAASSASDGVGTYRDYIEILPMISHFTPTHIHFTSRPFSREPLDVSKVDTVIFATGYWNALPFCKAGDAPWSEHRVLERTISEREREGGAQGEVGGLKGTHMDGMDGLLLFLKEDRSIAFPGLPYQTVPFPLFELQARLVSLLWAGLLPSFPAEPSPPPNLDNPAVFAQLPPHSSAQPSTPPIDEAGQIPASLATSPSAGHETQPLVRQIFATRREFVFPNPYEWAYSRYLMGLMREADKDAEEHWRDIEPWREARRSDTGLRVRTLGY